MSTSSSTVVLTEVHVPNRSILLHCGFIVLLLLVLASEASSKLIEIPSLSDKKPRQRGGDAAKAYMAQRLKRSPSTNPNASPQASMDYMKHSTGVPASAKNPSSKESARPADIWVDRKSLGSAFSADLITQVDLPISLNIIPVGLDGSGHLGVTLPPKALSDWLNNKVLPSRLPHVFVDKLTQGTDPDPELARIDAFSADFGYTYSYNVVEPGPGASSAFEALLTKHSRLTKPSPEAAAEYQSKNTAALAESGLSRSQLYATGGVRPAHGREAHHFSLDAELAVGMAEDLANRVVTSDATSLGGVEVTASGSISREKLTNNDGYNLVILNPRREWILRALEAEGELEDALSGIAAGRVPHYGYRFGLTDEEIEIAANSHAFQRWVVASNVESFFAKDASVAQLLMETEAKSETARLSQPVPADVKSSGSSELYRNFAFTAARSYLSENRWKQVLQAMADRGKKSPSATQTSASSPIGQGYSRESTNNNNSVTNSAPRSVHPFVAFSQANAPTLISSNSYKVADRAGSSWAGDIVSKLYSMPPRTVKPTAAKKTAKASKALKTGKGKKTGKGSTDESEGENEGVENDENEISLKTLTGFSPEEFVEFYRAVDPLSFSQYARSVNSRENCLSETYVGPSRTILYDLAAGPYSLGPTIGGDGVKTPFSLPSIDTLGALSRQTNQGKAGEDKAWNQDGGDKDNIKAGALSDIFPNLFFKSEMDLGLSYFDTTPSALRYFAQEDEEVGAKAGLLSQPDNEVETVVVLNKAAARRKLHMISQEKEDNEDNEDNENGMDDGIDTYNSDDKSIISSTAPQRKLFALGKSSKAGSDDSSQFLDEEYDEEYMRYLTPAEKESLMNSLADAKSKRASQQDARAQELSQSLGSNDVDTSVSQDPLEALQETNPDFVKNDLILEEGFSENVEPTRNDGSSGNGSVGTGKAHPQFNTLDDMLKYLQDDLGFDFETGVSSTNTNGNDGKAAGAAPEVNSFIGAFDEIMQQLQNTNKNNGQQGQEAGSQAGTVASKPISFEAAELDKIAQAMGMSMEDILGLADDEEDYDRAASTSGDTDSGSSPPPSLNRSGRGENKATDSRASSSSPTRWEDDDTPAGEELSEAELERQMRMINDLNTAITEEGAIVDEDDDDFDLTKWAMEQVQLEKRVRDAQKAVDEALEERRVQEQARLAANAVSSAFTNGKGVSQQQQKESQKSDDSMMLSMEEIESHRMMLLGKISSPTCRVPKTTAERVECADYVEAYEDLMEQLVASRAYQHQKKLYEQQHAGQSTLDEDVDPMATGTSTYPTTTTDTGGASDASGVDDYDFLGEGARPSHKPIPTQDTDSATEEDPNKVKISIRRLAFYGHHLGEAPDKHKDSTGPIEQESFMSTLTAAISRLQRTVVTPPAALLPGSAKGYAKDILFSVRVVKNHNAFQPLPEPFVSMLKSALYELRLPGQTVSVSIHEISMHEDPVLTAAVATATRFAVVPTLLFDGSYNANRRQYLDSALLTRELSKHARDLSQQRIAGPSFGFSDSFNFNRINLHSVGSTTGAKAMNTTVSAGSSITPVSTVQRQQQMAAAAAAARTSGGYKSRQNGMGLGVGINNLGTMDAAADPKLHAQPAGRTRVDRRTREIPIYLFSLSSPMPVFLDKRYLAKAVTSMGETMVLGVQSDHELWETPLACNNEPIFRDLMNPLQSLVQAAMTALSGYLPSHVSPSSHSPSGSSDWLWATGASPAFAANSADHRVLFGQMELDAAHRHLIVTALRKATALVNAAVVDLRKVRTTVANSAVLGMVYGPETRDARGVHVSAWKGKKVYKLMRKALKSTKFRIAMVRQHVSKLDFGAAISLAKITVGNAHQFATLATMIVKKAKDLDCSCARESSSFDLMRALWTASHTGVDPRELSLPSTRAKVPLTSAGMADDLIKAKTAAALGHDANEISGKTSKTSPAFFAWLFAFGMIGTMILVKACAKTKSMISSKKD